MKEIAILGGGPAGLSVGHYARKRSIPFIIYEMADRWGGNCVTFEWNGFRYDSGAHRLHGVDRDIVMECSRLLDGEIMEVKSPSRICKENRQYIFPLELKNIFFNMPLWDLAYGLYSLLFSRSTGSVPADNFENLAIRRYGSYFAKEFLLDYSEKLWGMSCAHLDASLAGKRLAGLKLRDILMELLVRNDNSGHMEGDFYYPKGGIGRLMDALAGSCGHDRIRLGSSITRIIHDGTRIRAIELNNSEQVEVDEVVSTLPLNRFLEIFEPALGGDDWRKLFLFRNLVLVALFLEKPGITDAASMYFPGKNTVFTRVYEPRNRCPSMSPAGKTSLVAEIPCNETDPAWSASDEDLATMISNSLAGLEWINRDDVLGFSVKRMRDAYPVVRVGQEKYVAQARQALERISNLRVTGRNGRFAYSWLHDQLQWGREVVQEMSR